MMENLKITLNLSLPFIADRFTTIDSILIKEYFLLMKEKGRYTEYSEDLSMIDFIDRKNGVFSGSIWYIPEDAPIKLDFTSYYKKSDERKVFDVSRLFDAEKPIKKTFFGNDGKAFKLDEEIILTPCVYFYIRGKTKHIEKLLKRLNTFGKKGSIGFGGIESIGVEVMDEDFSFQLNDTTPSKPLPIKDFDIKSKKIIHFRAIPPYWDNRNLVACYMPTTALYELKDESYKNNKFKISKTDGNGSGLMFIADVMDGKQGLDKISETEIKEDRRKKRWDIINSNKTQHCCFTGTILSEGVDNYSSYVAISLGTSATQLFKGRGNFLSKVAIWGMKKDMIRLSGDSLVTKDGLVKLTEKGAEEGRRFKDYMKNPLMLKPPFLIHRKTSASKQEHLILSSRVSVSNAIFSVQFGDKTLFIDTELLLQAVNDVRKTLAMKNAPTKSHLLGLWLGNKHPELSAKNYTEENVQIIEKFQKKYDKSIRRVLFSVTDFS